MPNLTNPAEIKAIMNKFGKHFAKSLGQNFLIDENVINITASVCEEHDEVLEIGPGIGVLTAALAKRAKKVVSVEIDEKLIPVLDFTLAEYANIQVLCKDIMKTDLRRLVDEHFSGGKIKAAANLPYYITTPIIMKLLENKDLFSSITVMVQKEVALRMAAEAGSRDYGMLSLAVQYHTVPEIMVFVPPESFMPPPKVSSAVICLEVRDNPPVTPKDTEFMFRLIKAAFSQRRKTFANAAANAGIGVSRENMTEALTALGFPADIRGEKLSLQNFADLSDILKS